MVDDAAGGAAVTDDTKTARRIVNAYLKDCGGINAGFDFDVHEDRLEAAIARALTKVRAEERKARKAASRG